MKKNANAQLRAAIRTIVEEAMGVGPDVDRVNDSILQGQIKERLGAEFFDIAMNIVHDVEEKVMANSAEIINQHNLTDAPHSRMTPRSLRNVVDQFDEDTDDKAQLMRDCANDIEQALENFAVQFAAYIGHIVSPSAR